MKEMPSWSQFNFFGAALHKRHRFSCGPLVKINCPPLMLDAELTCSTQWMIFPVLISKTLTREPQVQKMYFSSLLIWKKRGEVRFKVILVIVIQTWNRCVRLWKHLFVMIIKKQSQDFLDFAALPVYLVQFAQLYTSALLQKCHKRH